MQTDASLLFDLRNQIEATIHESLSSFPSAQEGTIVGSSFNSKYATAELMFGATLCNPGDDGNTYLPHAALPILTTQPGDLYGPTGIEKAIALPLEEGMGLIFRHGVEDSPQPGPGERFILHKSVASQGLPNAIYDAGLKHTNDGPTQGDGLGGALYGLDAALTQASTKSKHTVTLNDTTQAVTVQTSQGLTSIYDDSTSVITHVAKFSGDTYNPLTGQGSTPSIFHQLDAINQVAKTQVATNIVTYLDGINQVIKHQAGGMTTVMDVLGNVTGTPNTLSHIIPTGGIIGLGKDFAGNLPTSFAAVNETLMNNSFGPLVNSQVLTNFAGMANALRTVGAITGPQLLSLLTLLTFAGGGVLSKVGNFTGSQVVRIAS